MSKTFQNVSKEDFVREIKWHQEQDKIIQGSYQDDDSGEFKGCFMGCAVNSIARINGDKIEHGNHQEQAEYLGLPEWFVYLYEGIFEGLKEDDSKEFVVDCAEALPECETKQIDQLEGLIKIFIIESTKKYHNNKEVHAIVDQVVSAIKSGDSELLSAAESAARSAAESTAWSAARSAAWSGAMSATRSAAMSARSAAESASWSAAWSGARSATRSAEYKELSVYLIQLLKGL